jgi:hypothetical protein
LTTPTNPEEAGKLFGAFGLGWLGCLGLDVDGRQGLEMGVVFAEAFGVAELHEGGGGAVVAGFGFLGFGHGGAAVNGEGAAFAGGVWEGDDDVEGHNNDGKMSKRTARR